MTLKTEQECSIFYLDLIITRNRNHLGFNIFRKLTFTVSLIYAHSNHNFRIKMSPFHNLVNRIFNILLYKETCAHHKHLAGMNVFKFKTVDNLVKKEQDQFILRIFI